MSCELLIFVSSLMQNSPDFSRNALDLYFDGFTSGRHNCFALCGIVYFFTKFSPQVAEIELPILIETSQNPFLDCDRFLVFG